MKLEIIQFLSWQWLLLIPFLWGFLIYWYKQPRTSQTASIVDVELSAYNHFYHPFTDKLIAAKKQHWLSSSNRNFWKNPKFWLFGLLLSLLTIALSQPVLQGKRLPDPPPERDIVFLVDTSMSMQLKDYKLEGKEISRMELLRSLLDEFTSRMQGERISVILFAEKPYILVPLTSEQNLIRRMLGRITTTLAGRYAALGEALMMALNEAKQQQGRHQTFILFTDENTSRGKVTASAAAQVVGEYDIPIFT
ncbi:MAG: VWA domain-containing protein, partial [Gammaproteobacteria bacterium]